MSNFDKRLKALEAAQAEVIDRQALEATVQRLGPLRRSGQATPEQRHEFLAALIKLGGGSWASLLRIRMERRRLAEGPPA